MLTEVNKLMAVAVKKETLVEQLRFFTFKPLINRFILSIYSTPVDNGGD